MRWADLVGVVVINRGCFPIHSEDVVLRAGDLPDAGLTVGLIALDRVDQGGIRCEVDGQEASAGDLDHDFVDVHEVHDVLSGTEDVVFHVDRLDAVDALRDSGIEGRGRVGNLRSDCLIHGRQVDGVDHLVGAGVGGDPAVRDPGVVQRGDVLQSNGFRGNCHVTVGSDADKGVLIEQSRDPVDLRLLVRVESSREHRVPVARF